MSKRHVSREMVAGWLLFLILGWVSGCGAVATREPIYDPAKDGIFEKRLIGRWEWIGAWGVPEGSIEFSRGPGNSYLLKPDIPKETEVSESETSAKQPMMRMDLIKLGSHRHLFLNLNEQDQGTLLLFSYRVEFTSRGKEMHLRLLNTQMVGRFLQAHQDRLQFEDTKTPFIEPFDRKANPPDTRPHNLILTDSPAKIRKFLIQHLDDPGWLGEPWILYRADAAEPR